MTTPIGSRLFHAGMSRRTFIGALAAVGVAPRGFAQGAPAPVNLAAINHSVLRVSDPDRSVEFFRGLFGMPIVGDYEDRVNLRIGDGPAYLSILKDRSDSPGWVEFGLALDPIDPLVPSDPVGFADILRQHGMTEADDPGPGQFSLTVRGPSGGGSPEGTPELRIIDMDGIPYVLVHKTNCGGAGPLGADCRLSYPTDGLIKLGEINHCTLIITDTDQSRDFIQSKFDTPIIAYQGDYTPVYRVAGYSSIVYFDYKNNPETQGPEYAGLLPYIDHTCYTVVDYDFNRVRQQMTEFGLADQGDVFQNSGPMQHYYTSRRPNRGGAPGGTFEVYFTDPDRTVFQLQASNYCGGGGLNGEICGVPGKPSR